MHWTNILSFSFNVFTASFYWFITSQDFVVKSAIALDGVTMTNNRTAERLEHDQTVHMCSLILIYTLYIDESMVRNCSLTLYSIDTKLTHQQHTAFENISGKEEIAHNEQFLLFPQCFLLNQKIVSPFVDIFDIIILFAAELEEPKIGM